MLMPVVRKKKGKKKHYLLKVDGRGVKKKVVVHVCMVKEPVRYSCT